MYIYIVQSRKHLYCPKINVLYGYYREAAVKYYPLDSTLQRLRAVCAVTATARLL